MRLLPTSYLFCSEGFWNSTSVDLTRGLQWKRQNEFQPMGLLVQKMPSSHLPGLQILAPKRDKSWNLRGITQYCVCVCVCLFCFFSHQVWCGVGHLVERVAARWQQQRDRDGEGRPHRKCINPGREADVSIVYRTTHVSNPPVRETRQWQSDWIFGVYYQIWCLKIWCLVSDLIIRFGVYYLPVFLTFLGERETGKERGVKGRNQRHTTIQSLGKVLIFSSKIKNQNVHLCCLIGSTQKNVLIS